MFLFCTFVRLSEVSIAIFVTQLKFLTLTNAKVFSCLGNVLDLVYFASVDMLLHLSTVVYILYVEYNNMTHNSISVTSLI